MQSGTVKWFNNAKGYGFILSSDGVSDIFAHYSAITMDGYKTLKAGQEVSYELIEGEKGLHATNISPVGYAAETQNESQQGTPEVENE